jgi:tetratricopeptide (TPR) repeat protein
LLGSLLRSHGRLDESEASLVQARCDLEGALAVEPHDRAMLRQFAEATASLALVQGQRGHAEQQMELLLVAQAIKDRLVAEHPNDLGGVIAHALGCNAIAAAHHVAGRRDEALQWTERGITMLLRTRPEGPEAQTWRWRLALLLETRGNANLQLGRIDAAEQDHGESLALRLELLADAPSTASRVDYVSASWHNLSLIHRARQNFAAALECSLESIAHARQAVRMDPRNRQYREHFENSLSARCGYLLSLQRDADLPAAIDDLIAGASSPGAMLGAARFALRLARRLEVAAIAEDADVARWRARAMGQIETAVAAGFTDAAHFATGQWARHYDDLRADPGFAALLANLAARK